MQREETGQLLTEMEALSGCVTLLCLINSAAWGGHSGALGTRSVRLGDTVTLHCDISLRYEAMWLIQRLDQTLSLGVIASKNKVGPETHISVYSGDTDPRFGAELNSTTGSISLRIRNVTQSDLGLYYCAERHLESLNIGRGIRLVHEGAENGQSRPAPVKKQRHVQEEGRYENAGFVTAQR